MVANSTRGKSKSQDIDLEAEINSLREDISALVDRVSSYAEAGATDLAAKAEKVKAQGLKNGHEISEQLQRQLASLDGNVVKAVRDNPLPAIGIAAGIGFLAALMLRR